MPGGDFGDEFGERLSQIAQNLGRNVIQEIKEFRRYGGLSARQYADNIKDGSDEAERRSRKMSEGLEKGVSDDGEYNFIDGKPQIHTFDLEKYCCIEEGHDKIMLEIIRQKLAANGLDPTRLERVYARIMQENGTEIIEPTNKYNYTYSDTEAAQMQAVVSTYMKDYEDHPVIKEVFLKAGLQEQNQQESITRLFEPIQGRTPEQSIKMYADEIARNGLVGRHGVTISPHPTHDGKIAISFPVRTAEESIRKMERTEFELNSLVYKRHFNLARQSDPDRIEDITERIDRIEKGMEIEKTQNLDFQSIVRGGPEVAKDAVGEIPRPRIR